MFRMFSKVIDGVVVNGNYTMTLTEFVKQEQNLRASGCIETLTFIKMYRKSWHQVPGTKAVYKK